MPVRASVPTMNVAKVIGMYLRRPPMSLFMSNEWWEPEWLTDPRFAVAKDRVANFTELKNMIDVVLKTKTKAEWIQIFEANGMSYGDTLTMEQALEHEHTKAREMVVNVGRRPATVEEARKLLALPAKVAA